MNDHPQAGSTQEMFSRTASMGSGIVAVVALLALLDAGVETLWSGSPLRWWVAVPAIVFVALSVLLWRPGGWAATRWGASGAAPWSVGGLLLLFVVSAWLPEGQTNGVRMLAQPTPTLLTTATAAAVILAAFALFRALALIPAAARLASRAVLCALAGYAVLALGFAMYERAPYASLFQGGAVWQRLPGWLQGTFIGALVLLPLAIAGQAIRVIDHLRRKQPVRVLLHQATALVMAFVMAISGVNLPRAAATAASSVQNSSGSARAATVVSDEEIRQLLLGQQDPSVVWERYSRAAETELKRPGADPSDIKAKAAALGRDVQKTFEFVRDQITLEPYTGVLRGARGALAAGAGNALDRALLAQALLKANGINSRLVSGTLSDDQAEKLLASYMATSPVRGALASSVFTPGASAVTPAATDLSAKTGLPIDGVTSILNRAAVKAEAFWSKTDEQRATQSAFLADQLRRGGVQPDTGGATLTAKLRDRLKSHYWLQVKESGSDWSEFDPSFADAQRGTAYGAAPIVLSEVPKDAFHRFDFSLVYSTKVQGSPKQEVLLTSSVASADALFAPLEFQIQPGETTPNGAAVLIMDARQKIDGLRKIKRFQGILRAGTRVTSGRAFDLEGNTYDSGSGGSGGSVGGMFGGLFGGGTEEKTPGEFVELQVVLRVSGPGRDPMTQTRTLVRAADVKAPAFAPPLMGWEILVQPQWISADLAGFQILSAAMALSKAVKAATAAGQNGARAEALPPTSVQLLQLALVRQSAAADILAKQPGVLALVDQPMLTIAGHRLSALYPEEGRIDAQRSIDIVDNSVRYVAKNGTSQVTAYDVALRQGVADCAIEQGILEEAFPQTHAESGNGVLQRAQQERRPILLTNSQETEKLRAAGLTDADVAWIRANELPSARLLIATTSNGSVAWWSIRPDGNAILRASGGQGQGLTEHQVQIGIKVALGLYCAYEYHHAVDAPTDLNGVAALSCLMLTGTGIFFMLGHVGVLATWALIGFDVGISAGFHFAAKRHE